MTTTGLTKNGLERLKVNGEVGILQTTYKDNKFIDKEYIRLLEGLVNEDEYFYSVYTLGNWTPLKISGRIYKKFTDDNIQKWEYIPELPLILCCDFNVNPMKWALIQDKGGIDYVFDEIVQYDTETERMAKAVLEKYGRRLIRVYGDYSGSYRSTKSPRTDYEIIASVLNIVKNLKPNPPIINRVNSVNARLCNVKGERRLFVDPKCEHVIKDFRRVVFQEGIEKEDQSEPELTHISSAIGYYIDKEYPLKPKAKGKQW